MTPTARAVIDASCVLRAVVDDADDAFEWLGRIESKEVEGLAPDLLYAEVASGLLRQIRAERLTIEQAGEVIATVARYPLSAVPSRLIAAAACVVALERGLTAYDGHYVALAEADDAVLVTADRPLAAAATQSVLLE